MQERFRVGATFLAQSTLTQTTSTTTTTTPSLRVLQRFASPVTTTGQHGFLTTTGKGPLPPPNGSFRPNSVILGHPQGRFARFPLSSLVFGSNNGYLPFSPMQTLMSRPFSTFPAVLGIRKTDSPSKAIPDHTSTSLTDTYYPPDALTDESNTSSKATFSVKDMDPQYVLSQKSTPSLLRALLIFKMSSYQQLIALSPAILRFTERIGLQGVAHQVLKHTFFRHFCGGEQSKDVEPTMADLRHSRIKCILDLSVEADLPDPKAMSEGCAANMSTQEKKAMIYSSNRDNIQRIKAMVKDGIDIAAKEKDQFIALKLTSLGSPLFLESWTRMLWKRRRVFQELADPTTGTIDKAAFVQLLEVTLPNLHATAEATQLVDALYASVDATERDGRLDWIDVNRVLSPRDATVQRLFALGSATSAYEAAGDDSFSTSGVLYAADVHSMTRVLANFEDVVQRARDQHVRIAVDAEQSYFQPAIDDLAMAMMEHYNQGLNRPLIFNTYQLYLKDANGRMQDDMERFRRGKGNPATASPSAHQQLAQPSHAIPFGAKIVRGAYMVSERKRAEILGIESPVHDTIQGTHASFNEGVDRILAAISASPDVAVMVASHNTASIEYTAQRMRYYHIHRGGEQVVFGQLFGMCDMATYSLAQKGYVTYKYLPYGPIAEVVPYLLRRAQENASVLSDLTHERKLLRVELARRVRQFMVPPSTTM